MFSDMNQIGRVTNHGIFVRKVYMKFKLNVVNK